jgi:hypothetical protein
MVMTEVPTTTRRRAIVGADDEGVHHHRASPDRFVEDQYTKLVQVAAWMVTKEESISLTATG